MYFFKRDYLSDDVAKDLLEIIQPFFDRLGHFDLGYDYIEDNGNCIRICTKPEFIYVLLENQFKITVDFSKELLFKKEPIQNFKFFIPPLKENFFPPFSKAIQDIHKKYQIQSAFEWIERSFGYYDQFWLISSLPLEAISHLFLIHEECLKDLLNQVKKYKNKILEKNPNKIYLPFQMRSNMSGLDSNASLQPLNISKLNLSPKELDCMSMMFIGLTAEEIAVFSKVSVRTIQHRIENIKNKLGLEKRGQIVKYAYELQNDFNFKKKTEAFFKLIYPLHSSFQVFS